MYSGSDIFIYVKWEHTEHICKFVIKIWQRPSEGNGTGKYILRRQY